MSNIKSNLYTIIFMIFLFPVILFSQGLTDLTFGYSPIGYDAKTTAMQNIGVAGNASVASILINPAAAKSEKISFLFSMGGFRLEEKRAFPVYDRFDGVLTKGTYVVNIHKYGNMSFYLQSGILKKIFGLTFGIYSTPFSRFTYDYKEYVRENTYGDNVIGFNKISGEGLWRLNGINVQMSPVENLNIGLNMGMIAEIDPIQFEVLTYFEDDYSLDEDITSTTKRELDNMPMLVQLGATYKLNERFTFGMQLKLPVNIEMNSTNPRKPFSMAYYSDTTMIESFKYPLEVSGGFVYNARTPFRTRLFMDYGYRFYSAVKHEIGSRSYENLNNTYYVGTALEFTYLHDKTFSFSYKYSNSPTDRAFTLSQFGVGIGFPFPAGSLNIATGFAKRTYRAQDLFSDSLFGGDRLNSTVDDVVENYLFGKVSAVFYLK